MSRRVRRALGGAFAGLLLLGLAWLVLAALVRQRLVSGLEAWQHDMRAAGWVVEHAPARAAGWWEPAIVLGQARLTGGADALPGGLDWRAAAIRLAWWPRHPRRLSIAASGHESLRLASLPALQADGGAIVASLELSDPRAPISLVTNGLVLGQGNATVTLGHAEMTLTAYQAAGPGRPLLSVALGARSLVAAAAPELPLDLDAAAVVQGPAPLPGDPASRLRAWHAAGGSLVIQHLDARSGPMVIDGSGDGGLDAALQPTARATLHITGGSALVDQLADAGMLGRGQALAIGAVLGLLERTPPGGGPAVVTLPLVLADGRVTVGGFTLAKTRPLTW